MNENLCVSPEILDSVGEGVYIVDLNRHIVFWNRSAERITGFSKAEVMGFDCGDNILNHVDQEGNRICLTGCPLHGTMLDGEERQASVFLTHKDGHRVPVEVKSMPLRDGTGAIVGAVETFVDSTNLYETRSQVERLRKAALLDSLTETGNRRYLDRELKRHLDQFARYGTPSAVVMADIDHFKVVNDTFGHEVGDRVLTMVAATLQRSLRPSDTLGRWGGEEFLLLLPNVESAEELRAMLERLRKMTAASQLKIDGRFVRVTLSFGATFLEHDDTVNTCVNRADKAMYESKRNGRDQVTVR